MTIRCLIMGLIGPKHLELLALELKKIATFHFVYSSIYKYQPISTKLGQNIYELKISSQFDYGSNRIRTTGVIRP